MRLATPAALAAVALLLAPAAWAASPRIEHTIDGGDLGVHPRSWTGKRLSFADVDGDGALDILAQNADRHVYVIDPRTQKVLARVEPDYPYGPDLGPFNGPKAGDLDGDGLVELVNVNRAAVLSVWTIHPGSPPRAELKWEKHLDDHHHGATADGGPALADMDQDGKLDIVVQTEETGVFAMRHDRTMIWSLDHYGGNAEPLVADVDEDGDLDAVFFTDGGVVYAVDGPTGKTLWRFDATHHSAWPGSIPSAGLVEDLDGDGRPEVVFCARNFENATPKYAPGAPHYREHHFMLFMLRDGKLAWKAKPNWGHPMCSAYIMAHDANGDGVKEIFGMDWNTVGHKPGDWEQLGPAHAFSYDIHGKERWHKDVHAFNAKPPLALADGDGDGKVDVLAYGDRELVVLDARDGSWKAKVDLPGTIIQGPIVANLDDDQALEAVVAVSDPHALVVIELPPSDARPSWPGWEPPIPSPVIKKPEPPTPTTTTTTPSPTDGPPTSPTATIRVDTPGPGLALLVVAALLVARSKRFSGGPR